jgi:transcriptional regulator with XRE-family HTH domain
MKTLVGEVRAATGVTLKEISEESGVDSRAVRKYMQGLEVKPFDARRVDAVLIERFVEVLPTATGTAELVEQLNEERSVAQMLEAENAKLRKFARHALKTVTA